MAKKHKGSFTDLLSPKKAQKTIRAQTRYAYRPIFQQLGKEARASRARQRTIGKTYHGLTKMEKNLAGASARDYANQAKTYTGFLKTVGAEDTAASQQTQSQQNQIASKYGGKPSTEGSERAQAAAAQRGLSAANYGGYSQQQGAISRDYLRRTAAASRHEGIGQKSIEAQRGRQIAQDRRTALRDRADFSTKTAQEVRAGERDYLIQSKAFGETKRSNLAGEAISRTNAGSSRISAKASAKNARTTAQQAAYDRKHPNAGDSGGGGGGGKGGGRPGSRDDRQRGIQYLKTGHYSNPYSYLVGQRNMDPDVAKWVIRHLRHPKPPRGKGPHGTQGPKF